MTFDEIHPLPNSGNRTNCWLGVVYDAGEFVMANGLRVKLGRRTTLHYDIDRCYQIEDISHEHPSH